MRKKLLLLSLLVVLLGAMSCAQYVSERVEVEGSLGYASCLEGGAIPYGGGKLARAKVDKEFKGKIQVLKDCEIKIESE